MIVKKIVLCLRSRYIRYKNITLLQNDFISIFFYHLLTDVEKLFSFIVHIFIYK